MGLKYLQSIKEFTRLKQEILRADLFFVVWVNLHNL